MIPKSYKTNISLEEIQEIFIQGGAIKLGPNNYMLFQHINSQEGINPVTNAIMQIPEIRKLSSFNNEAYLFIEDKLKGINIPITSIELPNSEEYPYNLFTSDNVFICSVNEIYIAERHTQEFNRERKKILDIRNLKSISELIKPKISVFWEVNITDFPQRFDRDKQVKSIIKYQN